MGGNIQGNSGQFPATRSACHVQSIRHISMKRGRGLYVVPSDDEEEEDDREDEDVVQQHQRVVVSSDDDDEEEEEDLYQPKPRGVDRLVLSKPSEDLRVSESGLTPIMSKCFSSSQPHASARRIKSLIQDSESESEPESEPETRPVSKSKSATNSDDVIEIEFELDFSSCSAKKNEEKEEEEEEEEEEDEDWEDVPIPELGQGQGQTETQTRARLWDDLPAAVPSSVVRMRTKLVASFRVPRDSPGLFVSPSSLSSLSSSPSYGFDPPCTTKVLLDVVNGTDKAALTLRDFGTNRVLGNFQSAKVLHAFQTSLSAVSAFSNTCVSEGIEDAFQDTSNRLVTSCVPFSSTPVPFVIAALSNPVSALNAAVASLYTDCLQIQRPVGKAPFSGIITVDMAVLVATLPASTQDSVVRACASEVARILDQRWYSVTDIERLLDTFPGLTFIPDETFPAPLLGASRDASSSKRAHWAIWSRILATKLGDWLPHGAFKDATQAAPCWADCPSSTETAETMFHFGDFLVGYFRVETTFVVPTSFPPGETQLGAFPSSTSPAVVAVKRTTSAGGSASGSSPNPYPLDASLRAPNLDAAVGTLIHESLASGNASRLIEWTKKRATLAQLEATRLSYIDAASSYDWRLENLIVPRLGTLLEDFHCWTPPEPWMTLAATTAAAADESARSCLDDSGIRDVVSLPNGAWNAAETAVSACPSFVLAAAATSGFVEWTTGAVSAAVPTVTNAVLAALMNPGHSDPVPTTDVDINVVAVFGINPGMAAVAKAMRHTLPPDSLLIDTTNDRCDRLPWQRWVAWRAVTAVPKNGFTTEARDALLLLAEDCVNGRPLTSDQTRGLASLLFVSTAAPYLSPPPGSSFALMHAWVHKGAAETIAETKGNLDKARVVAVAAWNQLVEDCKAKAATWSQAPRDSDDPIQSIVSNTHTKEAVKVVAAVARRALKPTPAVCRTVLASAQTMALVTAAISGMPSSGTISCCPARGICPVVVKLSIARAVRGMGGNTLWASPSCATPTPQGVFHFTRPSPSFIILVCPSDVPLHAASPATRAALATTRLRPVASIRLDTCSPFVVDVDACISAAKRSPATDLFVALCAALGSSIFNSSTTAPPVSAHVDVAIAGDATEDATSVGSASIKLITDLSDVARNTCAFAEKAAVQVAAMDRGNAPGFCLRAFSRLASSVLESLKYFDTYCIQRAPLLLPKACNAAVAAAKHQASKTMHSDLLVHERVELLAGAVNSMTTIADTVLAILTVASEAQQCATPAIFAATSTTLPILLTTLAMVFVATRADVACNGLPLGPIAASPTSMAAVNAAVVPSSSKQDDLPTFSDVGGVVSFGSCPLHTADLPAIVRLVWALSASANNLVPWSAPVTKAVYMNANSCLASTASMDVFVGIQRLYADLAILTARVTVGAGVDAMLSTPIRALVSTNALNDLTHLKNRQLRRTDILANLADAFSSNKGDIGSLVAALQDLVADAGQTVARSSGTSGVTVADLQARSSEACKLFVSSGLDGGWAAAMARKRLVKFLGVVQVPIADPGVVSWAWTGDVSGPKVVVAPLDCARALLASVQIEHFKRCTLVSVDVASGRRSRQEDIDLLSHESSSGWQCALEETTLLQRSCVNTTSDLGTPTTVVVSSHFALPPQSVSWGTGKWTSTAFHAAVTRAQVLAHSMTFVRSATAVTQRPWIRRLAAQVCGSCFLGKNPKTLVPLPGFAASTIRLLAGSDAEHCTTEVSAMAAACCEDITRTFLSKEQKVMSSKSALAASGVVYFGHLSRTGVVESESELESDLERQCFELDVSGLEGFPSMDVASVVCARGGLRPSSLLPEQHTFDALVSNDAQTAFRISIVTTDVVFILVSDGWVSAKLFASIVGAVCLSRSGAATLQAAVKDGLVSFPGSGAASFVAVIGYRTASWAMSVVVHGIVDTKVAIALPHNSAAKVVISEGVHDTKPVFILENHGNRFEAAVIVHDGVFHFTSPVFVPVVVTVFPAVGPDALTLDALQTALLQWINTTKVGQPHTHVNPRQGPETVTVLNTEAPLCVEPFSVWLNPKFVSMDAM